MVKLAKENDESCVDAVGYGMVTSFPESALVKLATEIEESRVDAVGIIDGSAQLD